MRMLGFLLGVTLFVVAGYTQNALLGLGSVTLAIVAMLWPDGSLQEDAMLARESWLVREIREPLLRIPLLSERSTLARLWPEPITSNEKAADGAANKGSLTAVSTAQLDVHV